MVVGLALAAIQMGMALPTGFLFGVGYGTGVRVGYEQVYPLLFPKGARPTTSELAATMKGMNTVYDAIGGKDASRMGIAVGITNAGEILNNPDFQVLEKLESSLSGLTSLNSTPSVSEEIPSSLQLDPSFSSKPQKDSIFFKQPELTLTEKELLIKTIQASTSVPDLLNRRGRYTDPNLIQVIEARIRELRNPTVTKKIVNTVPTKSIPKKVQPNKQQADYILWQKSLGYQQQIFRNALTQINLANSRPWRGNKIQVANAINNKKKNLVKKQNATKRIVAYSNDYRSPNNTIRKHALRLRQEIAQGFWVKK